MPTRDGVGDLADKVFGPDSSGVRAYHHQAAVGVIDSWENIPASPHFIRKIYTDVTEASFKSPLCKSGK